MKRQAIMDLAILAVVSWGVWSLRFYGVGNIGLWTMVASVLAGFALLKLRRQSFASIGLIPVAAARTGLTRKTLGALGAIGLGTLIGFIVVFPIMGPPSAPSAVVQQPDTLLLFLADILFGVWVGAALGEEIFFRGLVLSRLQLIFGDEKTGMILAAAIQAIWFGAGHASQGLSGMVATGLIGLMLALFYMFRSPGNLWPLIIAHGLVNTVLLTVTFIANG